MSTSYISNDYTFGIKGENQALPVLSKYLNCDLTKTNRMARFDFEDTERKVKVELKTRRNRKSSFPTTMMPNGKLIKALKLLEDGWKVYLAFQFSDGLYIIEFTLELYETFEIKLWGRYDRGRPETDMYAFIPVGKLKKVE